VEEVLSVELVYLTVQVPYDRGDLAALFHEQGTVVRAAHAGEGTTLEGYLPRRWLERFREFFDMFREHGDVITNLTLWGIADDNTWLSEFSSGRQDFPLLFDVYHQPKPAFDAVMDF